MILSDITKRELIVDNVEEVERIKALNINDKHIYKTIIDRLKNGNYKVILIYSVGDYHRQTS